MYFTGQTMRIFTTKHLTFFYLLTISLFSIAQQDALYSQYMFNPMVLNPAYAGIHEMGMVTTTYRNQWTGIEGSPKTYAANLHTALPVPKMGAGITVAQERFGINSNTEIQAAFAYHLRLKEDKLNFGVLGSATNYKIDYNHKKLMINIILPHPRMHRRNFVLLPLFEINKDWVHPITKNHIKKLILSLPNRDIRSIKQI